MSRTAILVLLFSFVLILPQPFFTQRGDAQDAVMCAAIESYFRELDQLMFDAMVVYLSNEEWMKDMDRMSRKANASESGILTLTTEEMQPFVDIMSVPGDVLLDFPENNIPVRVRDFHHSSMSYWLIMPAMMRSIGSGGFWAAIAFTEDLESASAVNSAALADLTADCPLLVSKLEAAGDDFGMDGSTPPANLADLDVFEGLAFGLMSLPSENSDDQLSAGRVAPQCQPGRNELVCVVNALNDQDFDRVAFGRYTVWTNQLSQPGQVIEINDSHGFLFVYPADTEEQGVAAREADGVDLDSETLVITSRVSELPLNDGMEVLVVQHSNIIFVFQGGTDKENNMVKVAIESLP